VSDRVFLSGASLVLPDRIAAGRSLILENGRITDVAAGAGAASGTAGASSDVRFDLPGHFILPGFVDVHVHGVAGHDVLEGLESLALVAATLPRFGVTAFCPTSVACEPGPLGDLLANVSAMRTARRPIDARVLPAHIESNFINPEFRGAQPLACLRRPDGSPAGAGIDESAFDAGDIVGVIDDHRADVGILTLAPELGGALDLVRRFAESGLRVSLGHSAATFEEAEAAIVAGACHATHLFNRMPPMSHRQPGLAGAVLASTGVAAEIIADGHHVHPAFVQVALAAKTAERLMAITDGTAGSGLPRGSRARLGGQPITVEDIARLDDGTAAGSVATMDAIFRCLVTRCGIDICDAAQMCATTPARELGLVGHGVIAAGSAADLVVINGRYDVVQTWIDGVLVWSR
jgi:N-acetylglucosamine-6-phosphate deacetylase